MVIDILIALFLFFFVIPAVFGIILYIPYRMLAKSIQREGAIQRSKIGTSSYYPTPTKEETELMKKAHALNRKYYNTNTYYGSE
jgi:hypothetical protein